MLLVLSDKGKGMQSSSDQPLVGEEHCVTTLITASKETNSNSVLSSNMSFPFKKYYNYVLCSCYKSPTSVLVFARCSVI